MSIPFTVDEFLQVFAAYNAAIWPTQFILFGVAIVALYFSLRGGGRTALIPPIVLAALWAWSGVVYHLIFFRRINPAASAFGTLFVVQALLLLIATWRQRIAFRFRRSVRGWLGLLLILYALALYPLLGVALGRRYPYAPTFGVPCPLTILTLGLLLWNSARTPWYAAAVPLVWAAIGFTAALSLGIREDFGLGAAGVITLGVLVAKHINDRRELAYPHIR